MLKTNYKLASSHDFNVCSACYQNYHPEQLAKSFMVCDPCKEKKKKPNKCQDKNGKWFTPGDILRSESNPLLAVRIFQINPTTIVWCSLQNKDVFGCSPILIFIMSGWIVHERVTRYEVGPTDFGLTKCRFKSFMIGDPGCIICDHCKRVSSGDQNWVICELYNNENKES